MKKWNQQYHDKFKEFALIHKVWDEKNLEKAWKSVEANKGSAGIDGVTIEQFEQNLTQNLAEIQRLLKEKRYEPSPVLRVLIPKDNGKVRKLGIPTVRDRIVLSLIESFLKSGIMNDGIFEESFEGTPQGGNLSPLLSNIYLNHLRKMLRKR